MHHLDARRTYETSTSLSKKSRMTQWATNLVRAFIGYACLGAIAQMRAAPDHLAPIESDADDRVYRQLLMSKLYVTPAEHGRFLILPSSLDGEVCIAIHSENVRERLRYFVTTTKSASNLWSASRNGPYRRQPRYIAVGRATSELEERTAAAIHTAVSKELDRTRAIEPDGDNRVYVDGTEIDVFLKYRSHERSGRLGPVMNGRHIEKLKKLVFRLEHFPEQPFHKQPQAEREIVELASALTR